MIFVPTPSSTLNPSWTGRNKVIAGNINNNSSVLDLGCGHKDLLNYITPRNYLGLDFNNIADIEVNFNEDFNLPEGDWDYIVCSGLLEYLVDIPKFIKKIKGKSKNYIVSYWNKNNQLREPANLPKFSIEDFKNVIENNFKITASVEWKGHLIIIAKDL